MYCHVIMNHSVDCLSTEVHSACTESKPSAADGRPFHFWSAYRDGTSTATVDAIYTTPLFRLTGVIYAPVDGTSHIPGPKWG